MGKKALTLCLICTALILLASAAKAQGPSSIVTAWTDKPKYSAGQNGKLYVAYNNLRDDPVSIRNITVVFEEWWAYVGNAWVGNLTYEPAENEKTITEGTIRVFEIGFTVPSDGRAVDTDVRIRVYTNLPGWDEPDEDPRIYMVETQNYMEQLVTLFTIQIVVVILCTAIIAATVFLSVHRPQAMWKTEEK